MESVVCRGLLNINRDGCNFLVAALFACFVCFLDLYSQEITSAVVSGSYGVFQTPGMTLGDVCVSSPINVLFL